MTNVELQFKFFFPQFILISKWFKDTTVHDTQDQKMNFRGGNILVATSLTLLLLWDMHSWDAEQQLADGTFRV